MAIRERRSSSFSLTLVADCAAVARCRAVNPGLRLDTIAGASHWAMYDSASAVNRLLLDFHLGR